MTATYTFTVGASSYDQVIRCANQRAAEYWGRTPYKLTAIDAKHGGATITTQALEVVAGGHHLPPNNGRKVGR